MPYRQNFDLPRDLSRGLDEVEKLLHRIGNEIIRDAAEWLDDHKVNMDGDVKKSLTYQVDRFIDSVRMKAGAGANHAPYVHYGTKPHRPPIAPIRYWVKKKLNIIDEGEIKAVAHAVASKIAAKGTDAKPFLDTPFLKAQRHFARRIEAAFLKGLSA